MSPSQKRPFTALAGRASMIRPSFFSSFVTANSLEAYRSETESAGTSASRHPSSSFLKVAKTARLFPLTYGTNLHQPNWEANFADISKPSSDKTIERNTHALLSNINLPNVPR